MYNIVHIMDMEDHTMVVLDFYIIVILIIILLIASKTLI